MVIWVKEENLRQFLPLIPEQYQDEVITGEFLCLGALPEDNGDERTAAGVLLFSVENGLLFEDEQSVMIVIHWNYASGYYYRNYPEEVKIHLTLGIERSRNLATHLFTGKDPVMMRRGYFS